MLDALLGLSGRLVLGLLAMFLTPPNTPGWLVQIFIAGGVACVVAVVAAPLTSDDRSTQLSALAAFVVYLVGAYAWLWFRRRPHEDHKPHV